MKIDNLRRYVDLRNSLTREKAQLEERLRQINEALGETEPPAIAAGTPVRQRGGAGSKTSGRRGRPASGGLSLREAVLQVTSGKPMTKQEILDAVQALGYKFSTSNPMNSLGVILYGKNPRFRNEGGRFSPAGGAKPSPAGNARANNGSVKHKKRELSPEARERIAAAQRERWARAKGAK